MHLLLRRRVSEVGGVSTTVTLGKNQNQLVAVGKSYEIDQSSHDSRLPLPQTFLAGTRPEPHDPLAQPPGVGVADRHEKILVGMLADFPHRILPMLKLESEFPAIELFRFPLCVENSEAAGGQRQTSQAQIIRPAPNERCIR